MLQTVIRFRIPNFEWYGVFRSGGPRMDADGAFSCPNPHEVCVLCGGTASVINVTRGWNYRELTFENIRQAYPVPEHAVLMLADETQVWALGEKGVLWRSKQLCLDGLQLLTTDGGFVFAKGYARGGDFAEFRIDPATGEQLDWDLER